MPESEETTEPVKKSRIEKIAGPAVFVGCFVIWPATNIACSILGYKAIDKQVQLEELKAAAAQLQS
jgi:hypothetical protein